MKAENIIRLANMVANPGPAMVQESIRDPRLLANSFIPGASAWNLLNAYGDKQAADASKKQGEDYLLNRITTQNFADQGLNPDGSLQQEEYSSPNSFTMQNLGVGQPQAPGQGGGISAGYASAFKNFMDAQKKSQELGEQELGTLKERLEKLKGQPVDNQSLAKTLAAAADVWGGGEGQFTKLQGALNPNMTEAQKAATIAQLEDTIRKGRGDQTAAEVAMQKARMGYEADKMQMAAKGAKLPFDESDVLKTKESQTLQAGYNFQNSLDKYKKLVASEGPTVTGEGRRKLDSAYADLKIKYKEAANLGALTGPDMEIIMEAIAPATGVSSMIGGTFKGGKEGVLGSLKQMGERARIDSQTQLDMLKTAFPGSQVARQLEQKLNQYGAKKAPGRGLSQAEAEELARLEQKYGGM